MGRWDAGPRWPGEKGILAIDIETIPQSRYLQPDAVELDEKFEEALEAGTLPIDQTLADDETVEELILSGRAKIKPFGVQAALHGLTGHVAGCTFAYDDPRASDGDQEGLELDTMKVEAKSLADVDPELAGGLRGVSSCKILEAERGLLAGIYNRIAQAVKAERTIVTFNGKSFDFPFLRCRAMAAEVTSKGIRWEGPQGLLYPWESRISCDLRSMLGSGRYAKGTQKALADALGIESAEHGPEVWEWALNGDWDKLAIYMIQEGETMIQTFRRARRAL